MLIFLQKSRALFRDSGRELRQLRVLALAALLAALQIVISMFSLSFTSWLRVSFGFVFQAAAAMLFGPVVAGLQGVAADVVKSFLFPTGPFFPGFTLTALLVGVVYGCFFYRVRVDWKRALWAQGTINLLLYSGLNTLWMVILQGDAFLAILPARLGKNLLMLLVEVPLLVAIHSVLQRYRRRLG